MNAGTRLLVVAGVGLVAVACARMEAEERAMDPSLQGVKVRLASFPGAEQQIREYYEAHGQEGDYSCGPVDMGAITRVAEVANTATEIKLAFHYEFTSEDGGRSEYCHLGFNTRIATFSKAGGGLTLERMSGELGSA
jgi:hypothetical protein